MNQKQRTNESIPQNIFPGDPRADDLAAIQQKASALTSAGDAAVAKMLSGDSAKFLAATHQRGGQ